MLYLGLLPNYMGGIVRRNTLALLCIVIGLSQSALAVTLPQSALAPLQGQFLAENQELKGDWSEVKTWDSWLCGGFYQYKTALKARVDKLDLELTDDGHMVATVDLKEIHAGAQGSYRSMASACLPVGGWLGVGSHWARLKTEVHFGERADFKDIRLKILSTEMGRLEFGKLFPQWFEGFFTGVVNRALTVVWNSKMGDWLSEKITEVVRKNIPERNR